MSEVHLLYAAGMVVGVYGSREAAEKALGRYPWRFQDPAVSPAMVLDVDGWDDRTPRRGMEAVVSWFEARNPDMALPPPDRGEPQPGPMIVTVTPTIMDGQVVRWYRSPDAIELGGNEVVSASRNGVRVFCFLHEVPATVLDAASAAFATLRAGGDVKHLATHFKNFLGSVRPVTADAPPPPAMAVSTCICGVTSGGVLDRRPGCTMHPAEEAVGG